MKTLSLPKGSADPLPEWATLLESLAPLLRRATSRRSLERYVTGVLTDLPRKTGATIAHAVATTSLEQLQHRLPDAAWDPLALDEQRVQLLVKHSPAGGVVVLEDSGVPKHGKAWVGVQQQYAGTLAKQGTCQSSVRAQQVVDDSTTRQPWHWPLSARLQVAQSWAADRARWRCVRVPESVAVASKAELALHLLERASDWEGRCATVVTAAG